MISDIIDLNTECVLVQLQSQGNTMCLDDYTVEAVGSRTITNTSITADVTICGLDLCNDVLGFEARSNGEELDSMESQTSNESELPNNFKATTHVVVIISIRDSFRKISKGEQKHVRRHFGGARTVGSIQF